MRAPMLLLCGHAVCRVCVQGAAPAALGEGRGCPLCFLPASGISSVSPNVCDTMLALAAARTTQSVKGQPAVSVIICSNCSDPSGDGESDDDQPGDDNDDDESPSSCEPCAATVWCVTCKNPDTGVDGAPLCDQCFAALHPPASKIARTHVRKPIGSSVSVISSILDTGMAQPLSLEPSYSLLPSRRCPEHQLPLELFCRDDACAVCLVCWGGAVSPHPHRGVLEDTRHRGA